MKTLNQLRMFFLSILFCVLITGCVNVYERCPGTSVSVESTYQATWIVLGATQFVVDPDGFSDAGDACLGWTICPFLVIDSVLESVMDTVLYPADLYLSKDQEEKGFQNGNIE